MLLSSGIGQTNLAEAHITHEVQHQEAGFTAVETVWLVEKTMASPSTLSSPEHVISKTEESLGLSFSTGVSRLAGSGSASNGEMTI